MLPTVNIESLKKKLDTVHEWPSLYMFKFIVPEERKEEVYALFPKNELRYKESSQGKYVSVTAKVMMRSSEDVVAKYQEAHRIEGMLAL